MKDILTVKPDTFSIKFSNDNGETIGTLKIFENELVFEGNADESAKVFFEKVIAQNIKL